MLERIADLIKKYWPVVTALTFVLGMSFSGIRYYARAEANDLINAALVEPLDKLNKRTDELDNKLFGLQQNNVQQNEKLKGLEKQLDIIIELMKKDQRNDKRSN